MICRLTYLICYLLEGVLNVLTTIMEFVYTSNHWSKKHNNFYYCKILQVKYHSNISNAPLSVFQMWKASLTYTWAKLNIHLCVRKMCVMRCQLSSFAIHITHLSHLWSLLRGCKHLLSVQTYWAYKPTLLPYHVNFLNRKSLLYTKRHALPCEARID